MSSWLSTWFGLITSERIAHRHGAMLLISGCALGFMLGVLDIMEVEVLDSEQVEVRVKVEARETEEEEDKTRKQQTLRHVMTC